MVDVGWYRTTIRSFEREIFNIPNSVFSRNVVLNVTRKGKEWRFYEFIGESSLLCLMSASSISATHSIQSSVVAVSFKSAHHSILSTTIIAELGQPGRSSKT